MYRQTRQQKTLAAEVAYEGIGLHTGELVTVRFVPAPINHGIVFSRVDLPHQPVIPARIEYVCETSRNTTLGIGPVRIYTVEHLLAALYAYEINNLRVEISAVEPPAAGGSAMVYVEMIEKAQVVEQEAQVHLLKLEKPLFYAQDDTLLIALPAEEYRISYTLSYPNHPVLDAQFASITVNAQTFRKEIAPCRTFGLYNEILPLLSRGLIRGCSLANAVVLDGAAVFSQGGLFFSNEMARHKLLDLIGDMSLVGLPFLAHIVAIRSGHGSHRVFAEQLLNALNQESVL